MPATALAFALAAAVFHALWNLLLARAPDVEAATVVALLTAVLVFAPIAVVVWHVEPAVWPWLLGSGLLELAYFALLATAYRRAPLSVVYPIARGGAPVLVLVVSVAVLGHATSARSGRSRSRRDRNPARPRPGHPDRVGLAGVAIACCIAGYTLIDKQGIRHAATIPYLELSMLLPTLAYAGIITRVRSAAAVAPRSAGPRRRGHRHLRRVRLCPRRAFAGLRGQRRGGAGDERRHRRGTGRRRAEGARYAGALLGACAVVAGIALLG